jgi:ribosomal protein L44E
MWGHAEITNLTRQEPCIYQSSLTEKRVGNIKSSKQAAAQWVEEGGGRGKQMRRFSCELGTRQLLLASRNAKPTDSFSLFLLCLSCLPTWRVDVVKVQTVTSPRAVATVTSRTDINVKS